MKEAYKTDPEDITHVHIDENLSVPRHIVCAANKVGDLIICGARHHDEIMRAVYDKLGYGIKQIVREEQGFIDQYGQFVTREEAKLIVEANKQPLRETVRGSWCFSENLY